MMSHVNIGTGVGCTIRELADAMKEVVGLERNLGFDVSTPDGTPRKLSDVSRLESFGWKYTASLKDGLASTCQWFLDNQDSFRTR